MTRTHALEVGHLVMGLVFLGLAATWGLHELGLVGATDVEWLVPLALVAAGVLGLVGFTVRELRSRATRDEPAYEPAGYGTAYDVPDVAPYDTGYPPTYDPTAEPENGDTR